MPRQPPNWHQSTQMQNNFFFFVISVNAAIEWRPLPDICAANLPLFFRGDDFHFKSKCFETWKRFWTKNISYFVIDFAIYRLRDLIKVGQAVIIQRVGSLKTIQQFRMKWRCNNNLICMYIYIYIYIYNQNWLHAQVLKQIKATKFVFAHW